MKTCLHTRCFSLNLNKKIGRNAFFILFSVLSPAGKIFLFLIWFLDLKINCFYVQVHEQSCWAVQGSFPLRCTYCKVNKEKTGFSLFLKILKFKLITLKAFSFIYLSNPETFFFKFWYMLLSDHKTPQSSSYTSKQ